MRGGRPGFLYNLESRGVGAWKPTNRIGDFMRWWSVQVSVRTYRIDPADWDHNLAICRQFGPYGKTWSWSRNGGGGLERTYYKFKHPEDAMRFKLACRGDGIQTKMSGWRPGGDLNPATRSSLDTPAHV